MNRLVWIIYSLLVIVAVAGCKNQQKVAEEEAARIKAENTAQAKSILTAILNDDGQMTLDEKEKKLRQARVLNSDDPEVLALIEQVEDKIDQEREAQRLASEAAKTPKPAPDPTLEEQLSSLFGEIAAAGNSGVANELIQDGLNMFSSSEVPVLIIISNSGGLKDYDEPTTISRYLNYLKDQETSPNQIYQMVKDGNGKISELELIKKSSR